jgi:hypothetical protein
MQFAGWRKLMSETPRRGAALPPQLELDLSAGAKVAQRERSGDWYRDPWGWPELDWVASNASSVDIEDIVLASRHGYTLRTQAEFHLIEVPKSRLSVRPAVVQDIPSRIAYLSAIATRAETLHAELPDWVYGWRFRRDRDLGDNRDEWPNYLESLQDAAEDEWALQADLTSFFASIDLRRLEALVLDTYNNSPAAQLIIDIIRAHDKLSTRSGLPQRSFGSAALAHLYLGPLDDVITDALQTRTIRVAARWMDDINAIGPENELYKLHIRLQERSRQLGLELNPAKSYLAPADRLRSSLLLEDLREIPLQQRMVADYDDSEIELDPDQLLELEDRILSGAISHPTIARAVLRSLREHKLTERFKEWAQTAPKIPHLADPLSLYLRAAATAVDDEAPWGDASGWEYLGQWIQQLRTAGWTTLDWVDARYSLIFPHEKANAAEVENLRSWLHSASNLQKIAVAAQRLSAIDAASCRDIIRSRVDHINDSLTQRVLVLRQGTLAL